MRHAGGPKPLQSNIASTTTAAACKQCAARAHFAPGASGGPGREWWSRIPLRRREIARDAAAGTGNLSVDAAACVQEHVVTACVWHAALQEMASGRREDGAAGGGTTGCADGAPALSLQSQLELRVRLLVYHAAMRLTRVILAAAALQAALEHPLQRDLGGRCTDGQRDHSTAAHQDHSTHAS